MDLSICIGLNQLISLFFKFKNKYRLSRTLCYLHFLAQVVSMHKIGQNLFLFNLEKVLKHRIYRIQNRRYNMYLFPF